MESMPEKAARWKSELSELKRLQGSKSEKNQYKVERRILKDIKRLCYDPSAKYYPCYGGRGLKVHHSWLDPDSGLTAFIRDLGPCPAGYVLHRLDHRKGFHPFNVEWRSKARSRDGRFGNRNRSNPLSIKMNGVTKRAAQWGREYGLEPVSLVSSRVHNGWHPKAAVLGKQGETKTEAHHRLQLKPAFIGKRKDANGHY